MKSVLYIIFTCSVIIILYSCNKRLAQIQPFTISKVFSTDTLTTINAHINNRLNNAELLAISGKIKADSAKLKNMEIHFLLPGNSDISAGEHSYYAKAKFINESDIRSSDTLKDDNGNVLRLRVWGLSKVKAQKLLAMNPIDLNLKVLLGKYIDDYSRTVIIPFADTMNSEGNIYIIEVDSSAKVVSRNIPLKIKDKGSQKWQVTQSGDYITVKDSVLSQFAADGLGLPFNSIKSGI